MTTASTENATPADLLATIVQACDPLTEMSELKTASKQIDHLFGLGWHPQLPPLEQWLRGEQVKSVLTAFESKHSAKNLATAKKHKELADMYGGMVEGEFAEKAMHNISKAIIWAPFTEKKFLAECLLARAELHRRSKNNLAALADIEGALLFTENSNMLAICSKVALLKRLDRRPEAYHFLTEVLKSLEGKDKDSGSNSAGAGLEKKELKALRSLKKELKVYKHSAAGKGDQPDLKESGSQHQHDHHNCTLQVDPRLEWALEQSTGRHVLKATSAIEGSSVVLVKEEPALFIVRQESLHLNCSACFAECPATCWPCATCAEVVYCSVGCAAAAHAAYHRLECGILGALQPTAPQALQVYRHLARAGHAQLIAFQEEIKEAEQLTEPLQALIGGSGAEEQKVPRTQVHSLFGRLASLVGKRIKGRKPLRTATQLATATYLVAVYCYKSGEANISPSDFRLLVDILATELVRVSLAEYGWNGSGTGGENQRIHVGNYQCLVSSAIGHGCQPNADWNFEEQNFVLTSNRTIKAGEEVVITFGPTAAQPFFARQTALAAFNRLCHCEKCLEDAREHFALRCTFCNGPVPFDADHFSTELSCLLCERQAEKETEEGASVIQADFRAMQCSLWLVSGIKDAPEEVTSALEQIEARMAVLATVMPTNNRLLLSVVGDLCEEYLRRGMVSPAVEWFQWFASTDIYLDVGEEKEEEDIFSKLYHIHKWTGAYLEYLQSLNVTEAADAAVSYIEVLEQLVQRATAATQKLLTKKKSLSKVLEESQVEQVVEMLQQQVEDNQLASQKICASFNEMAKKAANCYSTGDLAGEAAEADF